MEHEGDAVAHRRAAKRSLLAYVGCLLLLAIISVGFNLPTFPLITPNSSFASLLGKIAANLPVTLAFATIIVGTAQLLSYRRLLVRIPVLIYHGIGIWTLLCFFLIQERLPLIFDVEIMVDGLGKLNFLPMETLSYFWRQIALSLAITIPILVFLMFLGNVLGKIRQRLFSPFLCLVFYLAGSAIFLLPRFSPNLGDSPIYARIPLMVGVWYVRYNMMYRGLRDKPLDIACSPQGTARHIVFVMDESIGGKYLGVNGYESPTTPFLISSRERFYNYGECSSSSNLSRTSNLIFMSGLRPDQIPDARQACLRQASVFGYAGKAGRNAYYIDSQNASHYNTVLPRDYADFKMVAIGGEIYNRDIAAVAVLRDLLERSSNPTYTFLLKSGCHFDYANKFPPGAYSGELEALGFVPETYHKAVRWNVDHFFSELEKALAGLDVLVVYTSDHGQVFNAARTSPHATGRNSPPDQANVPLIVWPFGDGARTAFGRPGGFLPAQKDRAWHFQLFPTVLILFGYDAEEVVSRFGPSLFHLPPPESRIFMSGMLIDDTDNPDTETFFNNFDIAE